MKKMFFFFLLGYASIGTINAQYTSSDSSKAIRKNELLIDASSIIPNSSGGAGLLYRRNVKTISLRAQLFGGFNHNNASSNDSNNVQSTNTYFIMPAIGIQKNVMLFKQFYWYGGADLSYRYSKSKNHNEYVTQGQESQTISLQPLTGVRYNYKRLVLGIECLGSLNYTITHSTYSASYPYNYKNTYTNYKGWSFNAINTTRFLVGINF
jgi:hypothetical protein